jgi:formate dehydrogenase subunit delta
MSVSTIDNLIYMANQIAREFHNQRASEASRATCDHIWHFWDPRMRSMILDHLAKGGSGLDPVVVAALKELDQTTGKPRSMTKATKFNQAIDPAADRDLMSDAG